MGLRAKSLKEVQALLENGAVKAGYVPGQAPRQHVWSEPQRGAMQELQRLVRQIDMLLDQVLRDDPCR